MPVQVTGSRSRVTAYGVKPTGEMKPGSAQKEQNSPARVSESFSHIHFIQKPKELLLLNDNFSAGINFQAQTLCLKSPQTISEMLNCKSLGLVCSSLSMAASHISVFCRPSFGSGNRKLNLTHLTVASKSPSITRDTPAGSTEGATEAKVLLKLSFKVTSTALIYNMTEMY